MYLCAILRNRVYSRCGNMTKYWANLLHIYQPPIQTKEVLERINRTCYVPLFKMLEKHDKIKTTLNISGVLLDLLDQWNHEETIQMIRKLVFKGNIEIVGTAKFHPLLPIIPEKEVIRQIQLNKQTNEQYFGKDGIGFFSPELAIDDNVLKIIKNQGYTWAIISGVASQPGKWITNKIQKTSYGLTIFYRDDIISNKIAFNRITPMEFVKTLENGINGIISSDLELSNPKEPINSTDEFLITALDGETFGHHIANYETIFLETVYNLIENTENVKTVFISDLIGLFPEETEVKPKPSSWSTTDKDLAHGVYFPLWNHPSNPVHKIMNKMMKSLDKIIALCDKYYDKQKIDINYYESARYFYDRAIFSCSSWWASMRPSWSPILIFKGADMMMLAALNAQLALTYAKVDAGEMFYEQITNYFSQLLNELSKQSANLINAKLSLE
jgi:hypothetical protein